MSNSSKSVLLSLLAFVLLLAVSLQSVNAQNIDDLQPMFAELKRSADWGDVVEFQGNESPRMRAFRGLRGKRAPFPGLKGLRGKRRFDY